jgi:hypothetical protein
MLRESTKSEVEEESMDYGEIQDIDKDVMSYAIAIKAAYLILEPLRPSHSDEPAFGCNGSGKRWGTRGWVRIRGLGQRGNV